MTDIEESIAQTRCAAPDEDEVEETSLPCKTSSCDNAKVYIYGVEPYEKCSVERISELSGAISRCIGSVELNRTNVKRMLYWAKELQLQLDMLDTMLIYNAVE